MKYELTKLSVHPSFEYAMAWYSNPSCPFERDHKLMVHNAFALDAIRKAMLALHVEDYDNVPLEVVPQELMTIQARYVEVDIGLHKHVSKKVDKRPILTRSLHVFIPQVRCECSGEFYRDLYDPRCIAQEIINKYWIPVDED